MGSPSRALPICMDNNNHPARCEVLLALVQCVFHHARPILSASSSRALTFPGRETIMYMRAISILEHDRNSMLGVTWKPTQPTGTQTAITRFQGRQLGLPSFRTKLRRCFIRSGLVPRCGKSSCILAPVTDSCCCWLLDDHGPRGGR